MCLFIHFLTQGDSPTRILILQSGVSPGTCWKCKFSGPSPGLSQLCVLTSPPRDAGASKGKAGRGLEVTCFTPRTLRPRERRDSELFVTHQLIYISGSKKAQPCMQTCARYSWARKREGTCFVRSQGRGSSWRPAACFLYDTTGK